MDRRTALESFGGVVAALFLLPEASSEPMGGPRYERADHRIVALNSDDRPYALRVRLSRRGLVRDEVVFDDRVEIPPPGPDEDVRTETVTTVTGTHRLVAEVADHRAETLVTHRAGPVQLSLYDGEVDVGIPV